MPNIYIIYIYVYTYVCHIYIYIYIYMYTISIHVYIAYIIYGVSTSRRSSVSTAQTMCCVSERPFRILYVVCIRIHAYIYYILYVCETLCIGVCRAAVCTRTAFWYATLGAYRCYTRIYV